MPWFPIEPHTGALPATDLEQCCLMIGRAGKWKGVTVAVKIVEHSSEANGGIRQLRESILSSSIIHPNVVRHRLHSLSKP